MFVHEQNIFGNCKNILHKCWQKYLAVHRKLEYKNKYIHTVILFLQSFFFNYGFKFFFIVKGSL